METKSNFFISHENHDGTEALGSMTVNLYGFRTWKCPAAGGVKGNPICFSSTLERSIKRFFRGRGSYK